VNLSFPTQELRTLCEHQAVAERALGIDAARQLFARLADLREADTMLDLPAVDSREVEIDGVWHYAFELDDGFLMLLRPGHKTQADGRVDWAEVTRVRIHSVAKSEVSHA
jgi:proteic killer suppression protein